MNDRRLAQLVERLPYTQNVIGSTPVPPTIVNGTVAQSVEQRTFNPLVEGSNPSGPTSVF